jgi:thiol-disulfide isomerase/thioredoxin
MNEEDASDSVLQRRSVLKIASVAAVLSIGAISAYHLWATAKPKSDEVSLPTNWWQRQWSTPNGAQIAMSEFVGKPLLLNFWASWCSPCVAELSAIDNFFTASRPNACGVLGLAVEGPKQLHLFLQQSSIQPHYPLAAAGMDDGLFLVRSMSGGATGLPFSVLFDSHGQIQQRIFGALSASDFVQCLQLQ